MSRPFRPRALLAALCAAAAFLAVASITEPPGPGLDPDAAAYLGAAQSLVRDGTLRVPAADWATRDSLVPLAHFPPGFPAAIAAPLSLGMSPPQAARLVVALAGAATAGLLAWLAAGAVGGGAGLAAGALAVLLAALSPSGLYTHLSVLSEPLYLACLAATLAALAARPGGRPGCAGLAAAAATMVRYVGLSAAGAAALWALAGPGPWRRRVRGAALAAGPAVAAFLLWALRSRHAGAPGGGVRKFGVYGGIGATVARAGDTLRAWLAPAPDPDALPWLGAAAVAAALAAAALLLAGARLAAREPGPRPSRPAPPAPRAGLALGAAGLLAACHVGFVVLSRLVADPGIPFDERVMAPAVLLAAFALAVCAGLVWRRARRRAGAVVAAGLALWLWGAAAADAGALEWIRRDGSDFASGRWRDSPTLAWVRGPGRARTLYSNWPAALYFHAGRAARTTPAALDARTLAGFDAALARTGGAVVLFAESSPDVAGPEAVVRALGLRAAARFPDGVVWERVPGAPARIAPPPPAAPPR